jgi:hypothetical protein
MIWAWASGALAHGWQQQPGWPGGLRCWQQGRLSAQFPVTFGNLTQGSALTCVPLARAPLSPLFNLMPLNGAEARMSYVLPAGV